MGRRAQIHRSVSVLKLYQLQARGKCEQPVEHKSERGIREMPKMFYFGPWDRPGHYLLNERGSSVWREERVIPWTLGQLDGGLQPHFASCVKTASRPDRLCSCPSGREGPALLHHKAGWTALAFWDRSVDRRGACCSVYMAEGTFTFDEMVAMAKERFAYRWSKMPFAVVEMEPLK